MTSKRLSAALLTLVLSASPSAALAQSAGDDQYEDPFGDEAPQTATPAPTPQDAQPAAPDTASGAAGAEPAPAGSPAPAPAAAAAAAPSASSTSELPRTGVDAGLLAAGGAGLLLCGVALRIRLADGGRRA